MVDNVLAGVDSADRSTTQTTPGWSDLGLAPSLVDHLQSSGYPSPTALQRELIPAVLDESNVVIEAPAGTGRTVAVATIVTELVSDCDTGDGAVALVITPNEQRCQVLLEAIQSIGSATRRADESGLRCMLVSELGPVDAQRVRLAGALDVVVGTPRRLNQLTATDHISFDALEMVVVDQADDLAVGDSCDDFAALLDTIEPDRQRVVMAGSFLPPLTDLLSTRLAGPRRPSLPETAPVASAPTQRAFAVGHASPTAVATVIDALGLPSAVVLVRSGEVETYRDRLHRSGLVVQVTSADSLSTLHLEPNTTVICVDLPTWTDGYASLLEAVSSKGSEELILLASPHHRHLLRAFGKSGGVKLNASPLPSSEGTESLRLERTARLVADQLTRVSPQPTPRFLSAVHQLSIDYDVADIAAAAMELAHRSLQREIEPGADAPLLLRQSSSRPSAAGDRRHGAPAAEGSSNRRKGGDRRDKELEPGMTRLFVAAGYNYGVRPGDIVGAFAGESGLSGKEIGNIDIREAFTLVEVPERLADDVIDAMQTGTIKGRQIEVRRERY
jgi:ATP-dependent RNA helicase DeaD